MTRHRPTRRDDLPGPDGNVLLGVAWAVALTLAAAGAATGLWWLL